MQKKADNKIYLCKIKKKYSSQLYPGQYSMIRKQNTVVSGRQTTNFVCLTDVK